MVDLATAWSQMSERVRESVRLQLQDVCALQSSTDVVTALLQPDTVQRVYTTLPAEERHVLLYFIFHVDQDLLSFRKMEQGTGSISPLSFRFGLIGLRRKGMVYTVRRQWGEVAYFMPKDVQNSFYDVVLAEQGLLIPETVASTETEIEIQRAPYPVCIDLFLLLECFRDQKRMEIPITRRRTIHKRYIRTWQDMLLDRGQVLELINLPVIFKDTYSQHMALLLDYLTRRHIIRWYRDVVQLDQEQANRWVSLTRQEMLADFLSYWWTYYTPSTPWLKRYQEDMRAWFTNKLRVMDAEWVYMLSFVERWEEQYDLPRIQELQDKIQAEILLPLQALGILEIGQIQENEHVWRFKQESEMDVAVWLQPNMELFVPELVSFQRLWKLTQLFQLKHWDAMLVMSLSREKAMRYIDREGSIQGWLDWFEKAVCTPIPEDFKAQIKDWTKSQQKVKVSDQTVLEIVDDELAKVFLHWPEVESLQINALTANVFVLSQSHKDQLVTIFQKRGLFVHTAVDPEENDQPAKDLPQPMLRFSVKEDPSFKIESVFPEATEAVPIWTELPDMWKKQFVAYHEQTKRELIKTAVEHGLHVKAELKQGDVVYMPITACMVEHGEWVCYEDKKRYLLQDLQRLQLMFPGSNET